MAAKLWGPMLTGIAQGFQDYQQGQEDLAYTRQARANQLASQQLANQSAQMQNQAQQQQLQNASLTHNYWVDALNSPDSQAQETTQQAAPAGGAQVASAAQGPAGGTQTGTGVTQGGGNFAVKGPLSMSQLSDLDKQFGFKPGTAYGLMNAESGGNPDAVSPKGAQGPFQVMPSTAAQPGYGLKAFNPKDPQGALGYFSQLLKKAGGDYNRAFQMWNAGPGGNADNPETKAFVPRVLRGQQQFANASALDNSKQQPTPADNIAARESAGVATPVTAYQQAAQAQQRQIQTMLQAAKNAERDGHPELAQNFYAQASKLQDQGIALQEKTNKIQKDANEETQKLAGGVKDQSSYNNFVEQIRQNPAMQAAVAGLNLTGDYDLDRNKMQTLADRATSLKDQQDLQIKRQELELKQQKEQRDQRKEEAPIIAQQQSQQRDQMRRDAVVSKGIPFVPSISSTMPAGTSPQQMQAAQKFIQTQNAQFDKNSASSISGARNVASLAAHVYTDLKNDNVTVGGPLVAAQEKLGNWALSAKQQEFNKNTNLMVQEMQKLASANGGARSASTAAMYKNYASAKPNITMDKDSAEAVAHGLYVGAASQENMNRFLDEYRLANPDAAVETGLLAWRQYEQAAGAPEVYDPATKGMVPNMAFVPKNEDGSDNADYKDYHVFFANGGRF